jgi:hypothetical protein
VIIPPGWKPENLRNKCRGCGGYLYLGCRQARRCGVPWKQQIDQMLENQARLRSYGV